MKEQIVDSQWSVCILVTIHNAGYLVGLYLDYLDYIKSYFSGSVFLSMLSKHVEHNKWPFLIQ